MGFRLSSRVKTPSETNICLACYNYRVMDRGVRNSIIDILENLSNSFGRVQTMLYDLLDRATNSVDANGVNINSTYDNLNRLRTRTYPDGGTEGFG